MLSGAGDQQASGASLALQEQERYTSGTAGSPGGGPYIILNFIVSEGKVTKASYQCNGCPAAVSVSSSLVRVAIAREIEKLMLLSAKDIDLIAGGLPDGKGYYAELGLSALQKALGAL